MYSAKMAATSMTMTTTAPAVPSGWRRANEMTRLYQGLRSASSSLTSSIASDVAIAPPQP